MSPNKTVKPTKFKPFRTLELGAISIKKQALDKNQLSVTCRENNTRIQSKMFYHNIPISDTFRDIIYDLTLNDGVNEVNLHKYYALSVEEKRVLRHLLKRAQLSHLLTGVPSLDEEETELLNRFELLKGTILAGNDSKELLIELEQLLDKLLDYDLISKYLHNKLFKTIFYTIATGK